MFTNLSMLADIILGIILVFLWVIQRSEKHALLWGLGQLTQFIATLLVLQLLAKEAQAFPLQIELICVLAGLTTGLLWCGTRYFCGLPLYLPRCFAIGLTLVSATAITFHIDFWVGYATGLIQVAFFQVWCGWLIYKDKHVYRIVGILLSLRGAVSLFMSLSIMLEGPLSYAMLAGFTLKTLTAFGMIYAVLDETSQRFQITIGSMSNGFLIRDAKGIIKLANKKCAQLFGVASSELLIGQNVTDVIRGLSEEDSAAWFEKVTAPNAPSPTINEMLIERLDGKKMPLELMGSAYFERGQTHALVQLFDISERKAQEIELKRVATTDSLSGLRNRHALNQEFAHALTVSQTQQQECSILFIDLDHFKRVNDSLGHSAGDELLIMVASRLRGLVGETEILARFGGDEFVIAQTGMKQNEGLDAAKHLASNILSAFNSPFHFSPHTSNSFSLQVTPSIGIAISPKNGLDTDTLFKHADIAMYAAKSAGRNQWRVFTNEMQRALRNTLLIEESLRSALTNNELSIVYQPIINAQGGRLTKVEALIRWTNPSLGFVPPDQFIPVAEECGLIVDIGRWVLQEACKQARLWLDNEIGPICISVNVSAWQLVDGAFLDDLQSAIQTNAISPNLIELELTERVLIEEENSVHDVLEAIHTMGVSISLDDFGTGYSSLSYLTRFNLDTLKIDRSFVNSIMKSERDRALVQAIIAMGHSLGLQMVAEGVENEDQARLLSELGCQNLQGYLFSRPVPANQIKQESASNSY